MDQQIDDMSKDDLLDAIMDGGDQESSDAGTEEIEQDENDGNGLSRNSSYTNRNNSAPVDEDECEFLKITFKSNNKYVKFMRMPPRGNGENDKYDRLDSADESRLDQIQTHVTTGIAKLRGTGIANVLENIGCPIEVDMSWDKELIRYIDDMTAMTNGNKTIATWSKQNIYTRHIAMLPGRLPIPIAHPNIYIMFDQSGSMSNNEVRKINYLIQYFFEKRYNVIVLIHDDAQNLDDVEIYEFSMANSRQFTDNMKLDALISSRIRAGGTSHKGVFDVMEAYIKEITRTTKKYNIQYALICSDLYSDIDEIYENYEWPNLIGNNTFALTNSDQKLPFGKTINILS